MSWVQPQPYDYRLFDQLDLGSPFGRLCLILAPALRIEPRLLRNARQRYLPRSDASLENRLWFSRVIETRSTRSVNLRPGLARRLVDQLAVHGGPHGRERLARICDFIAEQTRDWDPLDRIEQSLRWAVRDDDQARVGELLRELLRRIATSSEERSRADLARWIKGALPPLQAVTEAHRESGWLAQFAGAALGDPGIVLRGHGTPREPMPGWLATLLPASAGLTLGLRLGRSDERLILECLEPEPGLPRLDLFTPAPAPVHIECANRAQGSPGWVSLFVGCRIPVGRSCHALILQTLDGRRFRVASREGSEAIRADHSPSRSVVFVCASGDEMHAFRLADLLKRQGVSVRVEPLAASMRKTPDSAAAADPDEQLVVLWSRHAASAMEKNDPERARNVFSPAASGAAYRLLIGLDRTPLPEGIGTGGTPAARLDFSERSADWGRDEAQAVLSALSSDRPVALQVLRSDHTLEEFRAARLAADIAEVLPATSGRQARASALAQQIEASLRRRRPRGGIVDTVEIGGEVERALVRAGEHEAARAYAEPDTNGMSSMVSIYVSYAWKEEEQNRLVDRLGEACAARGIELWRDKTSIGYGDSIRQFMDEIGTGRHVVLVLSEAYFKSPYCMYELRQIYENKAFRQRVTPIVLSGTRFHKPIDRIPYIKYWEKEIADLRTALDDLDDPKMTLESRKDLDRYAENRRMIAELQSILADMNTPCAEVHVGTDFAALLDRISPQPAASSPLDPFRMQITDEIRKILAFSSRLTNSLQNAMRDAGTEPSGDLAASLCAVDPKRALEDLLFPATKIALAPFDPRQPEFLDTWSDAKSVLAWLSLLAVDSEWLRQASRNALSADRFSFEIDVKTLLGVELVSSRQQQIAPQLRLATGMKDVVGEGMILEPPYDNGWHDEAALDKLVCEVWEHIYPEVIQKTLSERDMRVLNATLRVRRKQKSHHHYIPVSVEQESRLRRLDFFQKLRAKLPDISVIFFNPRGDSAALLISDEEYFMTIIRKFLTIPDSLGKRP